MRTIPLRTFAWVSSCSSRPQAELQRLVSDQALQLGSAQRQELVDEPDPRIQLGVSAQALLKTRHTDEHQPDLPTVIQIAQLLEPRRAESIGFIRNDEFGLRRPRLLRRVFVQPIG